MSVLTVISVTAKGSIWSVSPWVLVFRVQLLGTIARGNFSCNLTRTEVNLTTGTFLGFIASLARSRIKASFLQQMATR